MSCHWLALEVTGFGADPTSFSSQAQIAIKQRPSMEKDKENRPPVEEKGKKLQGRSKQQHPRRYRMCGCKLSPCVVVMEWDDMWEVVESLKCSGGGGHYRREMLTEFFVSRLLEAGAARVQPASVPSCVKGIVLHHFPETEDGWYE